MLEPVASSRTKSQHEEELLVWKTRRRKSPKNIHRQNGRQKSIFTPAESDQFQIGTRIRPHTFDSAAAAGEQPVYTCHSHIIGKNPPFFEPILANSLAHGGIWDAI